MHGIVDDILKSALCTPIKLTPVEAILAERISFAEMLEKMRKLKIPPTNHLYTLLTHLVEIKELTITDLHAIAEIVKHLVFAHRLKWFSRESVIQDACHWYSVQTDALLFEAEKNVGDFDSHELNPAFQQFNVIRD